MEIKFDSSKEAGTHQRAEMLVNADNGVVNLIVTIDDRSFYFGLTQEEWGLLNNFVQSAFTELFRDRSKMFQEALDTIHEYINNGSGDYATTIDKISEYIDNI